MDENFIENRYKETAKTEITNNIEERSRVIASMLPQTGKLLDVGSWCGTVAKTYARDFLRSSEAEIYGSDLLIHPEAPAFFKEVYQVDLSKNRLPVEEASFDCVVASEVIEHVFDTDFLVEEIRRVLKPGGIFVVTTPNLASILNRIILLLGNQPLYTEVSARNSMYGNPWRRGSAPAGHIRVFTAKALRDIVRAHDFKIAKAVSIPFAVRQPFALLERLGGKISAHLGGNIILKCIKS